jgi:hypothetical protein
MWENKMAAAGNLYLIIDLMGIINELLELGT